MPLKIKVIAIIILFQFQLIKIPPNFYKLTIVHIELGCILSFNQTIVLL